MSISPPAGSLAIVLLAWCAALLAAAGPFEPESAVYVAAFRTGKHVNTSEPAVFHEAVDGVLELLKTQGVMVREDPARPMIRTADPISLESLLNVARDANADSLLWVTVDRPVTKWLKIRLECFDLAGKLLWIEEASEGGGMSGKNAVSKTVTKLAMKLGPHLGKPGLPLADTELGTLSAEPPRKEQP